MENDIVFEIIEELETEFCSVNGKEKIKEWQNFLNKWYYKELSRYEYELQLYIVKKLNEYLKKKIESKSFTDEEKLDVFKRINNTKYKKGLFNGEYSLLQGVNVDYDFVDKSLNNKDFSAVGHVLSNAKNALDIYDVLQSDWYYQSISTREFSVIVNQMKNTKNKQMFNLIFDELCMRDACFGYSLIAFLQSSVGELNSSNMLSIIKSIYIGGDDIRYVDKHLKKSSIILNLIKNHKLKLEEELSELFIVILEKTALGNEKIINTIVEHLSKEKKEKIKFYLPK